MMLNNLQVPTSLGGLMLIQHSHSWTKCLHHWWSHSIWQRAAAQWKRDLGKELSMQICCWLLILDLRISQNPSAVLGCFRQTVITVILLSWAGSWNIFRNRHGRVVRAKYADVKLPASVLCSKHVSKWFKLWQAASNTSFEQFPPPMYSCQKSIKVCFISVLGRWGSHKHWAERDL